MTPYTNVCVCGTSYSGLNCAHFLANWMIVNGVVQPNPPGTCCCPAGRPIRAAEMRSVFSAMGMSSHNEAPSGNHYIYCQRIKDGQDHVYYGTRTTCAAGTGTCESFEKREFWY
eukprot:2794104-Rhodomonas_salina.1